MKQIPRIFRAFFKMELLIRPLLLLLQAVFASPSAWRAFPLISRVLAMNDLPGFELFSRQSPSRPHVSVRMFFFQQSKLCETCPRIRQVSRPIDIPVIDAFLLLDIQIRMSISGYVHVLKWNRE